MNGPAVIVDWKHSVAARELDPILDLIPHRAAGGVGRVGFDHAVLAETHVHAATDRPLVTTVSDLAIVGDLRLWNRDGLRSRAGGGTATTGMSDRRLLLEAYRRTGIGFLDDVDGDFAFVIWDDRESRVIAVRDRFGMKPLFFERTPTGIRIATEIKQLAATSERPPRPNARSVAEYVTGHFQETRFTFFEGIERVRPSTALIVDPTGERVHRYWNPGIDTVPSPPSGDVVSEFREHLADSVRRRLAGTNGAVSHLSGGLDSTAIAAASHALADQDHLPAPFHTVSAVFPGYEIDESVWIDEIAAMQPFSHHDFVPGIDDIEALEADMWTVDQPRVNRIRGMWTQAAEIASTSSADLVFTGIGGDQILDQEQLLIDRLRNGPISNRIADARAVAGGTGRSVSRITGLVARDAVPTVLKRSVRRVLPRPPPLPDSLIRSEVWQALAADGFEPAPFEFDFPSLTQVGVIGSTLHPSIAWINEAQEAVYASQGLDLSQPYLDRILVEFVASIPPGARPFDGRTKTLVRQGFASYLPTSVINRRTKTIADDYLDVLFTRHAEHYTERYPTMSDSARPFLDADRYTTLLAETGGGARSFHTRESLWSAWTLMAWLDGLSRYRTNPGTGAVP